MIWSRKRIRKTVIYALVIIAATLNFFPLYYMAVSSFKSDMEIVSWPPTLIPFTATMKNYWYVINETPLLLFMRNSLQVAVGTTCLTLVLAVLGGYSLARFRLRGCRPSKYERGTLY